MTENQTSPFAARLSEIAEKFGETVKAAEFSYFFKSRKTKDKEGKEVIIPARDAITLVAPVPSFAGLIEIINKGGAGAALLQDAAEEVVFNFIKENLLDSEGFDPLTFDLSRADWDAIASAPREDGRKGISKERWNEFKDDYVAVMVQVSGRTTAQVETAAKFFVAKLQPVKFDKNKLSKLQELLSVYASNSANPDVQIVEFLTAKLDEFLNLDDADILG